MAVSLKHKFTLLKGDGADTTVVRPSNWNDEHALTLNSGNIVGRRSVGNGAAEEIPASEQMLDLLAAATADPTNDTLGVFETGDVKFTIRETASPGWLRITDGTIGNVGSGATYAAANAWPLYKLLWSNVANTYAPVTGGRGASAAADFAALKTMQLMKMLGRALAVAGAGAGLTARNTGQNAGIETSTLIRSNLPNITLGFTGNPSSFNVAPSTSQVAWGTSATFAGGGTQSGPANFGSVTWSGSVTPTGSIEALNGSVAQTGFDNIQPTTYLLCHIKL